MRDFISKVLSNRDSFLYETLTYQELIKIQDCVLASFGFTNLNELRDRFDGVAFIDKFSLKISGVMALEKKLKIEIIDWEKINPKNYTPKINIAGKKVDVIMSEYGDFPVIEKINKRPAIIIIKKDQKDIWICGYADVKILNENQNVKFLKGEMMKDYDSKTTFIGYNKLKPFQNFEDLVNLVKQKN